MSEDQQTALELDDTGTEARELVDRLWKIAPHLHRHPRETEVEAADRIAETAGTWRVKVLGVVARRGPRGATATEVIAALGGPDVANPYTIRPRLTDLSRLRLVLDSGKRRENRRGNREIVWVARRDAREALTSTRSEP